eukprot:TRINITY_DN49576_c0_g1_i1.p1 TRINITY_DN49576_c0_g1~~TRINITY_DN49576_c0_g1_i1.p1  ORF type:complete len:674 (+),score=129.33 TRINITY_DN49576_c0_g1_i1:90-2111(+)
MGCGNSSAQQRREVEELRQRCEDLQRQVQLQADSNQKKNLFLNDVLERLWPLLSTCTAGLIQDKVEPAVKHSLASLPHPFNVCSIDHARSTMGDSPVILGEPRLVDEDLTHSSTTKPCRTLTLRAHLEWNSDGAIYLLFTGASLGFTSFSISGNVFMELVDVDMDAIGTQKGTKSLLNGVRVFFTVLPDICFDIDRGKLAYAISASTIEQKLRMSIESKLGQMLLLPNCHALPASPNADILDIKRHSVEGLLLLTVYNVKLSASFASAMGTGSPKSIEVVSGHQCFRFVCQEEKKFTGSLTVDVQVPLMIWSKAYQKVFIRILQDDKPIVGSHWSLPLQWKFKVSGLIRQYKRQSFCVEDHPDDVSGITLTASWKEAFGATRGQPDLGKRTHILSIGVYSARNVPRLVEGTNFWVVMKCFAEHSKVAITKHSTTGRTLEVNEMSPELERKVEILRKHGVSSEEMTEVLGVAAHRVTNASEDGAKLGTVEWNEAFDILLQEGSSKKVAFELWRKAPSKEKEQMLGEASVSIASQGSDAQEVELGSSGIRLMLRLKVFCFKEDVEISMPIPKQNVQGEKEESSPIGGIAGSVGNALATVGGAVDNSLAAAVGGWTTAVGGLSAAAFGADEGASSERAEALPQKPRGKDKIKLPDAAKPKAKIKKKEKKAKGMDTE